MPVPNFSLLRAPADSQSVDARSALELQLTHIWKRVLDVPTVGVRDNFFDLGGHSLQAVRLVSEIHRSLSYAFPLPTLLQNPTVEAMARIIEAEESAGAPGKLIALQSGKSPGTLFFLNLGIELCRLAHLLDRGPSSFGTIVPVVPATRRGETGTNTKMSSLPALKEVAAAHVALIRGHMHEPCVLVGYCWGGRLAVEVAQQLLSQGRQVELILLLDAWATRPTYWQKLRVMTPDGALSSLKFRFDRLWSRVRIGASKTGLAAPPFVPFGELPPHLFVKFVRKTYQMTRLPLDSRAVLFRPSDCRFDGMRAISDGAVSSVAGWIPSRFRATMCPC